MISDGEAPGEFSDMLQVAADSAGSGEMQEAYKLTSALNEDEGFFQFGDGGGGLLLPLIGLVAVGVAVAVIASDDNDDDDDIDVPGDDNQAPVLTVDDAVVVDENIGTDEVIVDADADDADDDDVTFSLMGADAALFTIDSDDGEVRFVDSPDFEGRETYDITVVATDTEGNDAQQDVAITITDLDEDPVFVNQQTEFNVAENVLPGAVLFDPDVVDPEGQMVTLTLSGEDADMFAVDAETQAVFFTGSPDFEDQETLNFNVIATDTEGNQTTQAITVNVEDIADEPSDDDFVDELATLAFNLTGEAGFLGADEFYFTRFTELNDSDVGGVALIGFDEDTGTLAVTIQAIGLEEDMAHPQHIHGFMADGQGDVMEAMVPTLDDDSDGDGFIELMEAAGSYGPVLLSLTSGEDFPTPDDDGTISFTRLTSYPNRT